MRIPDYQRGYAWVDKQLKDFWNDLVQLDEDKSHYTGVLTLEEVPADAVNKWEDDLWIIRSKRYSPFYVVDGQQRLTTSIILIQCITENVSKDVRLNFTTISEIKKKFIYDSKDDGISRSYLFGYEKDNPSYEFLKTNIYLEKSDNSFPPQETIYTHNLERAKGFFNERLQGLPLTELEKLYSKLTQRFLFNLYSIANEVDVFVAFETMNNRGKPLSHLELLKNRLIYLSTKFDEADYERNKLRSAVNESWKSIYHYLGKNKANPLEDDVFLIDHFTIYHADEVEKVRREYQQSDYYFISDSSHMYQEYLLEKIYTAKNVYEKQVSLAEIYSYVGSLKESVEIWYKLLNPMDSDFSTEEKDWLTKINKLRIMRFMPLLLVVYQKCSDIATRVKLLKAVERNLFFHTIPEGMYMRHASFSQIAAQLSKGEINTDKVLKSLERSVDEYFTNDSVIESIIKRFREQGFYKWDGIKYFLFEYELYLKGKTKAFRDKLNWEVLSKEDSRDFYTVEHILPQKHDRDCWTSAFTGFSPKQKKVLANSLGNLVPLSQPKNSSFQNKCFADKKGSGETQVGFRYGSYSEIEVASNDDWTAREILERGIRLINFMETRWTFTFKTPKDKIRMLGLDFVPNKIGLNISGS